MDREIFEKNLNIPIQLINDEHFLFLGKTFEEGSPDKSGATVILKKLVVLRNDK